MCHRISRPRRALNLMITMIARCLIDLPRRATLNVFPT
jgi:hypothetical protein